MNTVTRPLNWRSNPFVRTLWLFFSHPQARAVGLVFASDSLLFGSWVAHIPHVKQTLQLSDGELGVLLFALPAGLITMNPFTGKIIAKLGEAQACFWAAVGLCLSICIPINAPNVVVLGTGLYIVGLCNALLNVAMNTCATNIERAEGISIISSCHGMWSLGGMIGSAIAGAVITLHITPPVHLVTMAVLMLLITFALRPILARIPATPSSTSASFTRPNLALLIMIFIGLALAMGEGVAFDWSAVYLRESLGATSQVAALGFGAFSLTMTLGRFAGDTLIPRIGAKRWLQIGGLIGALGLVLAILLPVPMAGLAGFALLGVGCSLGAPILYAAALRIPGIPPAAGLATFATFSFVGFLAGPPIIGFVAEGYGLRWGLAVVVVMLLLSSALAKQVDLNE
ncbi:MAG: MFS transporter [Bacteroidetes bacterium]|nr:MFS transporter [Fibrella sp.]